MLHRLLARPDQTEAGSAQLVAATDKCLPAMPVEDSPDNGEAKAIAARGSGTAIIEAGECRKHFFPILFGNTGAVVLHINAAIILIKLAVDFHTAARYAAATTMAAAARVMRVAGRAAAMGGGCVASE